VYLENVSKGNLMSDQDKEDGFLARIRVLSEQLKEGRFDKIDLSFLESETPDIAANFRQVVDALESAGRYIKVDSHDLSTVSGHLSHISETTEKGVMTAINTAEAIMEEAVNAKKYLSQIQEGSKGSRELEDLFQAVNGMLDSMQDHCFSVITGLEFEDINRQLMEKILARLNRLQDNLEKIISMLNITVNPDEKDSAFLESLRHIIDIDGSNRQTQDMIDDFFEDFGS
jgi:hypothetical protein